MEPQNKQLEDHRDRGPICTCYLLYINYSLRFPDRPYDLLNLTQEMRVCQQISHPFRITLTNRSSTSSFDQADSSTKKQTSANSGRPKSTSAYKWRHVTKNLIAIKFTRRSQVRSQGLNFVTSLRKKTNFGCPECMDSVICLIQPVIGY